MGRKTYVTEANAAMIGVIIVWLVGAFALEIPVDVTTAITGLVVTGLNIGIRMLHKKGLI